MYNVLPGSGTVAAWRIHHDGSLTDIGEFPLTIQVGGERLLKTIDGDVAMYEVSLGVLKPCEFVLGAVPLASRVSATLAITLIGRVRS